MKQNNEINIIRFKALKRKLGDVSLSSIYRWEDSQNFPKRIRLGKNSVGWSVQAVNEWIAERINETKEEK